MKLKPLKTNPLHFITLLVFILMLLFSGFSHAAESLCARVKIEIKQELTLERQAFDAHMRINNGLSHIILENVNVDVSFTDEEGNTVLATSDPDNTDALFFIRLDSVENIEDVSGSGTVDPATSADIHWLIIPAPGSSNGLEQGTLYYIGATLTYTIGGEEKITEVTPDYIFVKPMPQITLDYFLPSDVFGDDAFTPEIEPPVPFSLGVRVKNNGYGVAINLKIESAQPKIIENELGLLIGFVIEGSEVNGRPATDSLLADFGDIAPNAAGVARWIMTCTLSGQFVEFTAGFSHSDELGGELTSLIEAANTHFLVRDILVDLPGRDLVRDFLAKDGAVYRVYESDTTDTVVSDQSAATTLQMNGNDGTLTAPATAGFMVVKLADPFAGQKAIKEAIRSDGKVIKAENIWLSKTRDEENNWQYFINLFDVNTTDSYTVRFEDVSAVPLPPVMQFIPDRSRVEGQQVSFIVEASDPNGTIPGLSAVPLPAGASFNDQSDGTGIFDWIPFVGQAGRYEIVFTASDGALTDTQRAVITVSSVDDTDSDGMSDDWEMEHFGTLDRDGSGDYDGDAISDLDEYLNGADPTAEDNAPSVPEIQSPAAVARVSTQSPELVITNSTDEDGDTIGYEFEVFSDHGLTTLVASDSGVAEGTDTTTWAVPEILEDNTWYYWRVRASDGYSFSFWAYGSFFVNTENNPPRGFDISSPAESAEVDTQTPVLQVTNATDVDEDVLTYTFEIYADSDLTTLVAASPEISQGTDGTTSWQVSTSLSDNTWLYSQAIADDGQGAQSQTAAASFLVNLANPAPQAPAIASPAIGSEVTVPELDLVVNNAADPDITGYDFALDTVNTFDSQNKQTSGDLTPGVDTTSWSVAGLADNTRYFWRVKSSDGSAESGWVQGNFFVNTANDRPATPTIKNPGQKAWAETLTPTFEVNPVLDPDNDSLFYRFEVYADDALAALIEQGESDSPQWTPSSDLADKTRYYWRAQAEDEHGIPGNWCGTASFFIKYVATGPPTDIFVNVSTSAGRALSGLKAYAYTESGSYTGKQATTDENGTARFEPLDFTEDSYKFRVNYLNLQFWSDLIFFPNTSTADVVIEEETAEVTVTTGAGPAVGVKVYLYDENGTYLGIYATTDANGNVSFSLPSGFSYNFRTDIMGNQYWSGANPVEPGDANQFAVIAGGGRFTATVQEDETTPMQDIRVYLFHANGSYLNLNEFTDSLGQVAFDVPEGTYKVRADYLGYQFWSGDTLISADTDVALDIPHQEVAVTVSGLFDQTFEPIVNIPVYLFTAAGAYMNLNYPTDTEGTVVFHLPEQPYKVRADHLSQQFWSEVFTWQDPAIDISMADAEIRVGWGESYLEGVPVYVFTSANDYLNLNSTTAADGKVLFRLPSAGTYKFRADYQTSQFWSEDTVLLADQMNPLDITTGGGDFTFTVLKGENDPLVGVLCYVFNESGAFFGVFGPTSSEGEVSFDLAEGNYNIRVNYLGYQFWSSLYDVPTTLDETFTILHQDVTITVSGVYDAATEPLENIPVYLFTEAGAYMNLNPATDANGQVIFSLPDQAYKARADYVNQQYWSTSFTQADTAVDIPMADAQITVTGGGQALFDVPIYVITASGAYLNLTQNTNAAGQVNFRLPAESYKFRANYQGSEYWTDEKVLQADQVNPIEISTGGGPFIFTVLKDINDPLAGARCYVFSETGSYLNMNATTSSEGQVSFDLADGNYKYRVDHLGYQFWTDVYTIPDTLTDDFTVPHQDITITVDSLYQTRERLEGVRLYLFTASGAYMSQNQTTDANGQVVFTLPDQQYTVRADHMGYQFWSDVFQSTNTTVTIDHGLARVYAHHSGIDLAGARVYLYTGSGSYLNWYEDTDDFGLAEFLLPDRSYKFRADDNGEQYWSPVTEITDGVETEVEIDLDN